MLFLAEALGPRFIDEQFKADSSSAYVTTMHSAFGRQNTVKMAGLEYKGREDIEKKREVWFLTILARWNKSNFLASR